MRTRSRSRPRQRAADRAAADDYRGLRQLVDREELVTRHDDLAVDVETGKRARHRTGREVDRVGRDLDVAGLAPRHLDRLVRVQRAGTEVGGALASLEQTLQTLP